jgi:predicted  nucleic acid-binding Zn-ribbon protein
MAQPKSVAQNVPVEIKLKQLYDLQCIDSKIDALTVLQGELPLEVKDLEAETADLNAQQKETTTEIKEVEALIAQEKGKITTSHTLIEKYKVQIDEVRNNREHESLSKEIEFQTLEIELSEKKISGYVLAIEKKNEHKAELAEKLSEKQKILKEKKAKLHEITSETQKEIDELRAESNKQRVPIDENLLATYDRVRGSAHNGYAVVRVQRGACGGCYYNLPPQRQVDIKMNKKVALCEYCGRFLVNEDIVAGDVSVNAA